MFEIDFQQCVSAVYSLTSNVTIFNFFSILQVTGHGSISYGTNALSGQHLFCKFLVKFEFNGQNQDGIFLIHSITSIRTYVQ